MSNSRKLIRNLKVVKDAREIAKYGTIPLSRANRRHPNLVNRRG